MYDLCIDEDSNWKPYDGEKNIGEYFGNLETGEYINSKIVGWGVKSIKLENGESINPEDPKYKGWEECSLYQEYKNGNPTGNPYIREQ